MMGFMANEKAGADGATEITHEVLLQAFEEAELSFLLHPLDPEKVEALSKGAGGSQDGASSMSIWDHIQKHVN